MREIALLVINKHCFLVFADQSTLRSEGYEILSLLACGFQIETLQNLIRRRAALKSEFLMADSKQPGTTSNWLRVYGEDVLLKEVKYFMVCSSLPFF